MQGMQKKTIEDLNKIYNDSVSADREVYANQNSNVQLIAGNHYSGKTSKDFSRLRDTRNIPSEVKLRLTKNHIQKITKTYLNNIVSNSPGVKIIPRNEKELQDIKSAQLNDSVWSYAKDKLELDLKVLDWAKNYIDMGECAVKIFWNPHAGAFKGYNQKVSEDGMPMVDEAGNPVPDETSPEFEGELQIETILPNNLGRDASCTDMEDSPVMWIRKMIPLTQAKALVGNDPDKLKMIQPNHRESFMVFDNQTQEYSQVKDMCMIREYYFRPCAEYPMGYYYITTSTGILFEGELPFGIFPILYVGFDKIQSSPRHMSIVKQLRPYQVEINRTASKIAEHQMSSDDKILVQSGTKISSGGVLPGVRAIQYAGAAPTVLEGRAGAQYLDYMQSQITEMYQVANLSEDSEGKNTQTGEVYGELFKSIKEKKKFIIYTSKFESFLKKVCVTYLKLAKQYFTPEMLIPMIGKNEYVNMAEFKNSEDVCYQIQVLPMSDDVNAMWGKWLAINHTIQYASSSLGKEDIGRLLTNVPFGNFKESFSDLTMNYELANNYILALDRGEWVEPSPADDKAYMIKRLEKRMRESDFKFLHPNIQAMYMKAKEMFGQMKVDEELAIQRAQQGFIPTSGPLIKTDLQVEEPNTTGGFKTTRAAFPVDALSWLRKQMEVQGYAFNELASLDQSSQADLARQFMQQSEPQTNLRAQLTEPAPAQGEMNGNGYPNPTG